MPALATVAAGAFGFACVIFAPTNPTRGLAPLVAAPPRAAVAADGFVGVLVTGLAATGTGVRALDSDAAVGLLRRSAELLLIVIFFVGVGSCG